ncbi:uncharacterized protein LOC124365830 [Homalodisca vitripennis]|uniref:uncharacterized protein LOC124365830 n=1 Tax=Homalodisca vitripennis TaxID=197043 RepID=UPI001EE9ECF0|nr:uncharacterized protein LOC124365830 [Homalodisca vitripennis]
MPYYRGDVCSAKNCSNNKQKRPDLSFYRCPKEEIRCRKWVINSRREDLLNKDVDYLYNNIRFCSLHFEDSQFSNAEKKKLNWNAIPTMFDNSSKLGPVEIETLPKSQIACSPRRPKPILEPSNSESLVEHRAFITCTETVLNQTSSSRDVIGTNVNTENAMNSSNTLLSSDNVAPSVNEETASSSIIKVVNMSNSSFSNTPTQPIKIKQGIEACKLKKVIEKLRCLCKRKNKEIYKLRLKIKSLKNVACNHKVLGKNKTKSKLYATLDRTTVNKILSKYMKKESVKLILSQIKIPTKSKEGNRWDENTKIFAQKMFFL